MPLQVLGVIILISHIFPGLLESDTLGMYKIQYPEISTPCALGGKALHKIRKYKIFLVTCPQVDYQKISPITQLILSIHPCRFSLLRKPLQAYSLCKTLSTPSLYNLTSLKFAKEPSHCGLIHWSTKSISTTRLPVVMQSHASAFHSSLSFTWISVLAHPSSAGQSKAKQPLSLQTMLQRTARCARAEHSG